MPSYLIDTNVLLRSIDESSPQHFAAVNAIKTIFIHGDSIFITPQNLIEFWAVSTRPKTSNGLGISKHEALFQINKFWSHFSKADDSPAILEKGC